MKLKKRRLFPFIKQRDMTECGTTCLSMIFKYFGLYNVQTLLRDLGHVSQEGTDLYTLSELAQLFGFNADGYELSYDNLSKLPLPAIAHYDGNHFVVILKVFKDHILVADPAYGKDKLTRDEFEAKWNGIAMTVEPTQAVFKNPDVMELVEAQREKDKHVLKNFYLSLLYPFKPVIVEILAASFILQILVLALPFFTQVILDQVLVHRDRRLLFAILVGMVLIVLTQVMLTYVRNILLTQFKVRFELDFFSNFFRHLIRLKQSYFDAHRREDFIHRFQENLKIRDFFSPGILQTFIDLIFIFNALILLFFYNVTLSLVALGFVLFFTFATIIYTPRLRQLEDKIYHENLRTMGSFLDTLLGMLSVKLLTLEKAKFWSWKNQYKRALNKVLKTEQTHIALRSTLRGAYFISLISVYWIGAFMSFNGQMTIGQYIAFVTVFTVVMNALDQVSGLWFLVTELSVTYTRLNDVFVQETEKADLLSQQVYISEPAITFKDVTFSYSEREDTPALLDVNLTIPFGRHVAIIGRNGSGKSTMVKLLAQLYTEYEGQILLNNVDLRNVHPHYLRRKVVLVPQEVYLFAGTLKENIAYGNPSASMEAIVEAATLADVHDFIQSNYLGYNYKVGEGGSNLSGGQRLKIAFARLFLMDPEVLILDEAGSFLDLEAEAIIMKNVRHRFRNKTVITIAHRLHTVRTADEIIVLDEGRIVEKGNDAALLENAGLYAHFIKNYLDLS